MIFFGRRDLDGKYGAARAPVGADEEAGTLSCVLDWLLTAGLGPAVVAVPVNWTAAMLAGAARGWFRRLGRADDLSRLVKAATGTSADLSKDEFAAVRQLLEDQQTWDVAGRGTVADLASRIALCLPPREGRTAAGSQAAALTIARGLLEFAVADLEPKQFQQLLLTRLQRLQTDQASALDRALVDLHADLAAGFSGVMSDLRRALDRLPPGPAGRAGIVVYLTTLIDWMNADPWPTDQRFGGPVLAPAAIERRLRISVPGGRDNRDPDADDLARRCERLVILGGPGSGKTWLAKRTARHCAQEALDALRAGQSLDQVELPLYTTCSGLSASGGDIRQAAVSSAITQLGDLGGARLTAAIGAFFTERNAPTVLVIDALDEAHGSGERLRQAGTLPWRIVLTSRPSSWNRQLVLEEGNQSHVAGELQPLRYPADVVPFIRGWFGQEPELGHDLAEQIALRPDLQQAATVPLILAMYCIIGGSQALPESRHDLHGKVLRRMLTGRWRDTDASRPDVETCLRALRAWAWDGAATHPVSGVGQWADDVFTEPGRLAQADEDALDHIAPPAGLPDVDTGRVRRRFIHRSIREHLVAGHVAGLPADEAAEVLLPHLWYDPDWEFAAPAALAMHPERDQLVRELIRRAARSDDIPGDLSVIDGGWELRGLLARVAAESSDADWSPEIAGMIGRVRVELALSGHHGWVPRATGWGNSNRQAREALTRLVDGRAAPMMISGVVALAATAQDRRETCRVLLGLIPRVTETYVVGKLLDGVVELAATEDDRHEAWQALAGLVSRQTDGPTAADLASRMAPLAATGSDQREARQMLIRVLGTPVSASTYNAVMSELAALTTTQAAKDEACQVLLELLVPLAALGGGAEVRAVPQLLSMAVELATTEAQKGQARAAGLTLLTQQTTSHVISEWLDPVLKLGPTEQDKLRVREALLALIPRQVRGSDALAIRSEE